MVAVACFLPGRTKDLSVPPRKLGQKSIATFFVGMTAIDEDAELGNKRGHPTCNVTHRITSSALYLCTVIAFRKGFIVILPQNLCVGLLSVDERARHHFHNGL